MPFQFVALSTDGDLHAIERYDHSAHVILEHRTTLQDEKGVSLSSPAMEGMSGGGIWRLTPFNRGNKKWTSEEIDSSAFRTIFAGRYCKGTWIQKAISVIWRQFPELRPAIEWHAGVAIVSPDRNGGN